MTYRWLEFVLSLIVLNALFVPGALLGAEESPRSNAEDVQFFETRIRPVLVEHCYRCHAATSRIVRGGLRVDSGEALRKGGDSGPALEPGKPDDSLLIAALRYESLKMPPAGKLPDEIIADFITWISKGAPDPRGEQQNLKLPPVNGDAAAKHWAFRTIPDVTPPQPADADIGWVRTPIDRFIARKLRDSGFAPAASADKRTLIRRATLDLIGLPPSVAEVNAFLADSSPNAFAKVIDRLLNSPHYGERWGRHWLDLVRYADTNGADENHALPNAWRYRDWVVRQLNDDLPFDDFIVQQLAGDLLPVPDDEPAAGDLLTATGMLVVGPKMLAEQDKDKMLIDIVDEQLETVGRTMLGLTIGCARCHDHKFDPVSTRDYYALAGIFYSTRTMADRAFVSKWLERPLPSREIEARRVAYQPQVDEAKKKLEQWKEARAKATEPITDEAIKAQEELVDKLVKAMPAFDMAMAVQDDKPTDLPVHIRGNHRALSPDAVPRAMPAILTREHAAPPIAPGASGRLELARWLVAPENPLTARVMVNRLWMWHFGEALMRSPSNFGLQAEAPTHPELLDWLARELMRRRWSFKEMHRLILLSATYQMTSQPAAADEERDPGNRYWRRQNQRRLEAEPIRDSVLFVGGELDLTIGRTAADTDAPRRAIYLPINRSALYEMFSTFDYVETANHIEQRPTTIVPQQALFLMNSPLVVRQAQNLAQDLLRESAEEGRSVDRPLIRRAFERTYSRLPADSELSRAEQFLRDAEVRLPAAGDSSQRRRLAWAAFCRTLLAANEFIYID